MQIQAVLPTFKLLVVPIVKAELNHVFLGKIAGKSGLFYVLANFI